MKPLTKTAFHIHTDYSDDSNASIQDIIEDARRRAVHCVAITDHDTIEGARELATVAGEDLDVIIGQEISTADGHLIGLFLREVVEPGRPVRQTAQAIHSQGGLVVTPHPFNLIFGCSLREKVFDILDLIDAVEVSNAQNLSPLPNLKAGAFAARHGLPAIVGTDTHHRGYLDSCCQLMKPFDGPRSFLTSLRDAILCPASHPLSYFARSAYLICRYKLGLGIPPAYGRNADTARPAPVAGTLAISGE